MHPFDIDIACETDGHLNYSTRISGGWTINGTPNGGYLMAVLAEAVLKSTDKKDTPIITANFISRCSPGKADIKLEHISQSRQFNRIQAKLFQDGSEKIRAIFTLAEKRDSCFIERMESPPPEVAPRNECIAIPAIKNYTLFNHLDALIDPECAGWMEGNLTESSLQKGWIKFKESRAHDMPSLALFSDSFPPAVLATQGMIAWVPTIEFSLNIRNLPETEWLKCSFRTRFINCGLVEEDGEMWDENGTLIAISRQIAQFRKSAD